MSLGNCKNCDREFKEEYEFRCSSCGSVGCATCDRNPDYYHLVSEYCDECVEEETKDFDDIRQRIRQRLIDFGKTIDKDKYPFMF